MKKTPNPNPLRLRKKHGDGSGLDVTAADGARLVHAQSFRTAVVAGLIVIVVFCILWLWLTVQTDRIFPWMTVVQGTLLGFAIRRAGRGVDWRFPTLAAVMAVAGAVIGNIVLGASTTADDYGIGTVETLRLTTNMTWPLFFDEVWNIADGFFAVVAAGFAAFFANRRLSRAQFYALRRWREEQQQDD